MSKGVLGTTGSWRAGPRLDWLIASGLVVITAVAYVPVLWCGFVNYDDNVYVKDNFNLARGLSWSGIRWAFTAVISVNWHPLTLLSLLLDYTLFGLKPWGYHLVNLLLHLANSVLLFRCLRLMTGAVWRSAVVAALFALHPLHVESVAWVSERKDVLSTLFGLLALRVYIQYVAAPSWYRLAGVALLFLLSLLAKPMWVTFPFLLLLLDFWPLTRRGSGWKRFVVEKLPLFFLAAAFCFSTLLTQIWSGKSVGSEGLPFLFRLGNACVSYVAYLRQTILPKDLCVHYRHPALSLDVGVAICCGVLVGTVSVLVTVLTLRSAAIRREAPYWFVGWWWFVGTLVPVIGLIQVGTQARADRYTYVPLVGIFLMLTWGIADLFQLAGWPRLRPVLAAAVLLGCAFITTNQNAFWRNSVDLWTRAVNIDPDNAVAQGNLGDARYWAGDFAEALVHLKRATALQPYSAWAHDLRGLVQQGLHNLPQALEDHTLALRLDPMFWQAHVNRGLAYSKLDRDDQALEDNTQALKLNPSFAKAWYLRGTIYLRKNGSENMSKAVADFSQALELNPFFMEAYPNRGVAYQSLGQFEAALQDYNHVLQLNPGAGDVYCNRAKVYYHFGQYEAARRDVQRGRELGGRLDPQFVAELEKAAGGS